jgi:hypothetical protein
MRGGERRFGRVRAAVVLAVATATTVAAVPAGAVPVAVTTVPAAGWSTNGPVYATVVIGNTVYAGGSFTQVRDQSGTQVVNRTNLAAFDRTTGAVRTGFAADTDAKVRALATDGTHLFVGGAFLTVGGVARKRVASLAPATGAVDPTFVANASSNVYALFRRGAKLYVGGAYSGIGGYARTKLAAVSTTTGAVDPTFKPVVDNTVTAVAVSPDATTVYAGGQFTSLGGVAQSFFGAVSATTGLNTGRVFTGAPTDQVLALDVSPDGARVFTGSVANRAASYNTLNGARQWQVATDGDVQAVRYFGGNLFFGFHDGYAGDTTVHLLAVDAVSGILEPWRPAINSFWGVWAIAAGTDSLAVGGEFTTFSGVRTQGIAMLGPAPVTPPTGTNGTLSADTYVNTASPTKNYGTATVTKLHNPVTAEYRPLVQFSLSGLAAKPTSVHLRFYVTDASDSGGSWYRVADTWSETSVVWDTAPAITGAPVATLGAVTAGTWVDVDVTGAVTGNGTYSFMATSPSTNTAQFASRESATPPAVVIVP